MRALQEFESAVGKDWVFSSDDDPAPYNDTYSPFVVEPSLQMTANKYKIPLYAFSTGRNLGYGGSASTQPGSVIVDSKRMNRVLEVNRDEAYAVVEPGVSFLELYRHFEEHQHSFVVATPKPGWGSPLAMHSITALVSSRATT